MQAETLIHPRSRFESHFGSILIGRRCLVYEQAHLGARPADITNARPGGIAVGDYVTIEAKCVIEAGGTEIGESTLIQAGAKIGSGAKVGKNCTITQKSTIAPGVTIPDGTVVFANGTRRADRRESYDQRKLTLIKQLGVLRKMIPSDPDKFK